MTKKLLVYLAQKVKTEGKPIRIAYDTIEGSIFIITYKSDIDDYRDIILGYVRPDGGCILDQLRKLYFNYYVDKVGKNYEGKLKRDIQKKFIPKY